MPWVRIAAAGDVHADERRRPQIEEAFARVADDADIVLLAGDLTTHGLPEEAQVLADACRDLPIPVVAVLGNHDWHSDRVDEVAKVIEDAGVTVLERSWAICDVNGTDALDRALTAIAECPLRVVLLHYSPTMSTLRGEPETIWTFLGSNRLDGPIQRHKPHLVLHGHAHEGTFAGAVGAIPVYNVAVHVTRRDFFVFELDSDAPDGSGAKLEAPVL